MMYRFFLSTSLAWTALAFCTALFSLPAMAATQKDPALQGKNPAIIAKGKYLARVGDCTSCHTAADGKPFAGGRPLPTPFGTLFSPNITPDAQTGIGKWSFNDFWQALHAGKGAAGEMLYPAFPYTSYTKTTKEDAKAIFAYLSSIQPVRRPNLKPQLRFPYNIRKALYVWRALYFNKGTYQVDTSKSPQWNRGAYLVKGLGHCNECHTTRNALGAMNEQTMLSGGKIPAQGWYAPDLSTKKGGGLEGWTQKDIMQLLKTGMSRKGGVFGPMADVVRNSTQYLNDQDLKAIAIYLDALPAPDKPRQKANKQAADYAKGKKIFSNHCTSCHGDQGEGDRGIYPPLGGNSTVTEPTGINAIRSVLLGGFPPATAGNPQPYSMPPFAGELDNKDAAAVVNYIRQSWGNNAPSVAPEDVAHLRAMPAD